MKKKVTHHRGVLHDQNWEWQRKHHHDYDEEREPWDDPIKHIPGYGILEWTRHKAANRLASAKSQVAHLAIYGTSPIDPAIRDRFLQEKEAFDRADEILDQVYASYTGDYRL